MLKLIHCHNRHYTVKHFKYLGFLVTANGNLNSGMQDLCNRALKVYYMFKGSMGYAFRKDITITLSLFDLLIKPILLYNSDFMGMSQLCRNLMCPAEVVMDKFYKDILGIHGNVASIATHLELMRYPISIEAQKNCLNNWLRIHFEKRCNKLLELTYSACTQNGLKW